MIKIMKYGQVPNSEIFARVTPTVNVEEIVADIIANVRRGGDKAVLEYNLKFDKAELSSLLVSRQEIEEAITTKKAALLKEEQERIINSAEVYDESLPYSIQTGSYHPITLVQRDLERIFASLLAR